MKQKNNRWYVFGILCMAIAILIGFIGCAEPEVERVEATPDKKTLTIGERVTFKAVARQTKGEEMLETAIKWNVDGKAGSIDASGVFPAEKPGEAAVIASVDGITAKANVTVTPAKVATLDLRLRSKEVETFPGNTIKLTVNGVTSDEKPARY